MPPPFIDHVALLGACLDRRAVIVEAIERQILNVQDKETSRTRDRGRLARPDGQSGEPSVFSVGFVAPFF